MKAHAPSGPPDGPVQAPEIRASYMKLLLEESATLPPDDWVAIRREVGTVLDLVAGATRVDWLSAEVPRAFAVAAVRLLGVARARSLYRATTVRSFRSSLLGPIFAAGVRMLDGDPGRVLRFSPKGFANVWRGCGELAVVPSVGPGGSVLHTGVPEDLIVESFLITVSASLEAIPEVCGHPAQCAATVLAPRTIRYDLRW